MTLHYRQLLVLRIMAGTSRMRAAPVYSRTCLQMLATSCLKRLLPVIRLEHGVAPVEHLWARLSRLFGGEKPLVPFTTRTILRSSSWSKSLTTMMAVQQLLMTLHCLPRPQHRIIHATSRTREDQVCSRTFSRVQDMLCPSQASPVIPLALGAVTEEA